jgi:WD40 repeat protein
VFEGGPPCGRYQQRILPVNYKQPDIQKLPEELRQYQFIPTRGVFDEDRERSVGQLIIAIETDRDWVREHTDWALKAIEWSEHDRDASFLLSGSELEAAEQWLARQSGKRPEPTALHTEFVLLSRRLAVWRARRTRAITSAALAIVSALAVIALVLRNQAVNESQLSSSRQMAADSLLRLSSDPQLSLLLGVQSARVRQTPEALDALRRALPANHLLHTMSPPDGRPIDSAALSPNGSLVAAASRNYVVRVWSRDGQPVNVLQGHSRPVLGVAFDATSTKVLTWAEDGTARLWSVTGSQPPVVMHGGDFRVIHAAISRDGRLVATSFFLNSPPTVFSAATGQPVFTLGKATTTVPDVEFSPNGREIATGSVNGNVWFWNAANGAHLASLKVDVGPRSSDQLQVNQALFSPDGRYLLVSTSNGTMAQSRVWNLSTRQPATAPFAGADASWSPDGRYVITTTPDNDARIWDAGTGQLLQTLHGPNPIAGPAVLSTDGESGLPSYAVTGSQDGTADLWNPSDGTIVASLVGTHGAVTPAAFSADASRVLTFGSDGSSRIWSTGAIRPQSAPIVPRVRAAVHTFGGVSNLLRSSFALDPDPLSPLAAFYNVGSGAPTSATVIDTHTGARVTVSFPTGTPVSPISSNGYIAFDASGRVALVMGNGPAQIRSARTGQLLHTVAGVGSLASNGAVSADGKLAAAANDRDQIGVWDVATGRHIMSFDRQHPQKDVATAITLKFSPDGTLLLSADQSGVRYVWKARTGQVLNKIIGLGPPPLMYNETMGGAISPNDQFVVTTSGWDNNAHVYQVGQPTQLTTLQGHSDGIYDASFSPDNTLIATTATPGRGMGCTASSTGTSCDDSIRVWDTQQSSPLLTLRGDGGTRVDFSPDGSSLIVNSAFPYATLSCIVCGGFSRIVPLATHAEVRQLTPREHALYHTG